MKKLLLFVYCLTITGNSFAWTNHVSAAGSDTAPYDTWAKAAHSIQDAVNYAIEGNVVLVADGTYTVSSQIMIVTNNIILKSVNGAGNVSIDGNSTKHPIYLRGRSVIDGFSIINGKSSNGGGIFVQNYGTILNCIFTNNVASDKGGAIAALNVNISNCYFYANGAENGGAISLRNHCFMKDCILESNFATNGGAVYCFDTNAKGMSDCVISNNNANIGGGIYVGNGSSVAITNTVVEFNSALFYGGGVAVDGGSLSVAQNCHIRDNGAANGGGGIYANNADVSMTGTNTYLGVFYFWSGANRCTGGDGGGMYAVDSDIVLSGKQCYAGYNYSVRDGAAFYITNSSLSLLDGVQILAGWTSRNGGGIFALDSEITMDNSAIMYCGATNGGGIFAVSCSGTFNNAKIVNNSANAGIGGGILAYSTGDYYFTDSIIANNSGHNGGGIVAYLNVGDFILNNTDVITNRARGNGAMAGGIYWFSLATLEATNGCRISNNIADGSVGGAYLPFPGKFLFNDTEISYNTASNVVGGIAIGSGGEMKCTDCSINNNIADVDSNGVGFAGAIWSVGTIDLISLNGTMTVTNNGAVDGGAVYLSSGGRLSAYGDVLFANNHASRYGGAIYATNQCFVSLLPTNGFSPRIIDNLAVGDGGGAAIYAASKVTAVNTLFENNISANFGGAVYLNASTGTVYGAFSGSNSVPPCSFIGNNANLGGGIYMNSSLLDISDSILVSNTATVRGGAIRASSGSAVNMINSIAARNNAPITGGIAISPSSFLQMKECTVVENGSDGIGGGTLAITNSIVWNNSGTQITAGNTVDYCDVDGGYATGNGNIDVAPMFENPAALDFRLKIGSPCIDTGTVVNVHNDCIGDTRPMGLGFDLGAYELDPAPILNVIPLVVDFGDVVVGDNADLPVTVENFGNGPLNGNVINLMIPIFSVQSGSPYSVAPLSSNIVTFRFSPIVEFSNTNLVTFQSDGGNIVVTLIGSGIPEGCSILLLGIFILFFKKIK